jgi:UDP-GlcNAc:undecaprenyl-phosphate/decaprenyl-phosphate GlcNAc-1-phosphate transferase
LIYLTTFLISMFTTIVLIPIFSGMAGRLKALDMPNERKVHTTPIPKVGGIAMALGIVIPILLWAPINQFIRSVMLASWIIVLFGVIDDLKDVNYKVKFLGQIAAALIVIVYGGLKIKTLGGILPAGVELPRYLSIPITLIAIVGVTNAINLSDGLDGLAGGICLLSFICLSYLSYQQGYQDPIIFSVAMIGAILGFLRFNTYPASVFMGDAGSQLLGFIFITLSLGLTQNGSNLNPLLPIIFMGLPILDTLTVMAERVREGRWPFHPDKKHMHHKLLALGFYHNESVLLIYIYHAFFVTSGFLLRHYSEWFLLAYYFTFSALAVFILWICSQKGWNRRQYRFIDLVIKGRLRVLKEKKILVKVSFCLVQVLAPIILIFSCLVPQGIPDYFALFASLFLIIFLIFRHVKTSWQVYLLRVPLFLMIPFIIYIGEEDVAAWMGAELFRVYNMSFGVLVIFILLTLRFSRRQAFKSTPMDFLILFIALVVPNLPDSHIQSFRMGLVAAKIIAMFFSFEVLIGELRSEHDKLVPYIFIALLVVLVRAYFGI